MILVIAVSVTLAAQRLAGFLAMTGQWRDVVQSIRVVGSYMVVTILAMLVAGRTWLRSYFGLVERAFYAGMLTFLVLTSVKLVTGHLM